MPGAVVERDMRSTIVQANQFPPQRCRLLLDLVRYPPRL